MRGIETDLYKLSLLVGSVFITSILCSFVILLNKSLGSRIPFKVVQAKYLL